eukprot:7305542-Prymnesium_polylepis.1
MAKMTTASQLFDAFELFDVDNDGRLSVTEMLALLTRPGSGNTALTLEDAQEVVDRFDQDGDGMLDLDEFVKAFAGDLEDEDEDEDEDGDGGDDSEDEA